MNADLIARLRTSAAQLGSGTVGMYPTAELITEAADALEGGGGDDLSVQIQGDMASRDLGTAIGSSVPRDVLGEAIYRAMYEHQGGQWSANETKGVWYDIADRLKALLVGVKR